MESPILLSFSDHAEVEGALDAVAGLLISGWARRRDGGPVDVVATIDDRWTGATLADKPRPAGGAGGDPVRCGFAIDVPAQFLDGEPHRIRVVAAERFELTNSPQVVRFSSLVRGSWHLDGAQIVGAVMAAADGRLALDIFADGRRLGTLGLQGKAGVPAPFSAWLPWTLFDGMPHTISVRQAGAAGDNLPTTTGIAEARFCQAVRSVIDRFEQDAVTGWAYDTTAPNDALDVALYDGDRLVAKVRTRELRADVNERFKIGGAHGFTLIIPAGLFDGRDHDLRLMACGAVLRSEYDTARLPKKLPLREKPGTQISGQVEAIDCVHIRGWALDRDHPFRPVHVAVTVDGKTEIVAVADRFEKRLQRLSPSGFHGFLIDLPPRLSTGTDRQVEVRALEGDVPLVGKESELQHAVFFPLIDFPPVEEVGADAAMQAITALPAVTKPAARTGRAARHSVSAIVLNWNGAHLLRRLLDSLAAHAPEEELEVIVVDHGSSDDSRQIVKRYADKLDISLVARDKNYSFSHSNNLAARRARGDYLLFINNDIVLTRDIISPLAAQLAAATNVGIIGVKLVEPVPRVDGWSFATHHCGIGFVAKPVPGGEKWLAYFPVESDGDAADLGLTLVAPAVTAAAFMCRKTDFLALGGFDEAYFYGMEDVDFCLRMGRKLHKDIVCDTALTAIHLRSATRESRAGFDSNPVAENPASQSENRQRYAWRFAYHLRRTILQGLIAGDMRWRASPLRVAFAVTAASATTRAGDYFTALELGAALRAQFGWEPVFVRHTEGRLPGVDVLVAMRHNVDLSTIEAANPGLITVAWIRNRVDEWIASGILDRYDLLFCSSAHAVDMLAAQGWSAKLLPIATNPERFRPDRDGGEAHDIVFTGNYWGVTREAIEHIDPASLPGTFAIYGAGWDEQARWAPYWKGNLPYEQVGDVYAAAKIVIDDSHPVTRNMHSLNSRVFDALAAGALVITNCSGGAAELFGDDLPTFADASELNRHLSYFLTHEKERRARIARLRRKVLDHHTYVHRAGTLRENLAAVTRAFRVAIKIGVPRHEDKERWGDWHFALGLKRALATLGCRVRIDILPEWDCGLGVGDDAVIVLRGLSRYAPKPGAINLMWLISHPEAVAEDELRGYDHVFVASESYAKQLAKRLGDRVSPLLQCTDPGLFHPGGAPPDGDLPAAIFVGNSRKVRRKVVDDAIKAGVDVGVFGGDWEGLIPPRLVRSDFVPNVDLHRYYSAAGVVLNDHWPDMRREGFLSNRLFDAGACGAAIISDDAEGLKEVFGDAVLTYATAEELKAICTRLTRNPEERRTLGNKLRRLVVGKHTFAHRAAEIMRVIQRCDSAVCLPGGE